MMSLNLLLVFSFGYFAVQGDEHILSRVRRVIGGEDLEEGEAPYLTFVGGNFENIRKKRSIFYSFRRRTTTTTTTTTKRPPLGEPEQYCAGSLISDRWALTAAHCFDGKTQSGQSFKDPRLWKVKIGSVSLNDLQESRGRSWIDKLKAFKARWFKNNGAQDGKYVGLERIIIHPDYNEENPDDRGDIAVVRLEEDVQFGPNVQKIKLNSDSSYPPDWSLCKAQGWGCTRADGPRSDIARTVTMPIFDSESCAQTFDINLNICAGYFDRGRGICLGDSGGPLLCKRDGELVQVGVAYLANPQDPANNPSIYVRVSSYLDWIKGQTGI
ncbi:serine protease 33-like [Saccostrea echinata]|uniref:serine protease 33-like n=1 Tax=Saccostrea echinata TaxID=191078 RepID=UPI002A7F0F15|nr:serine protease 33-like [Saccostrea echinata]